MISKRIFFFLLVLGLIIKPGLLMHAQDNADTTEVGIAEHLGSVIPAGLSFTDENNRKVLLTEIIKKPTILILIYFDCPGVCPQILSNVSDMIENITMDLGRDYQVVTVSFNPADNPERALDKKKQFLRKKSRLHEADWIYLTGDSLNIYSLSNAVGFKFQQAGNDFIHPACITILSPEGKITRYLYGTTFLPFDVKMALIEAQKGLARPTINRVLDFCYTYDPAGRRYSLEITKVSGIIILFFALILLVSLLIRSRVKRNKNNQSGI